MFEDLFEFPVLKFDIGFGQFVESESEKKYVTYKITVRRELKHADLKPATIHRRYTEFLDLYESLKHEYPEYMDGVTFPRKIFLGNFESDVIANRSTSFTHLLEHITSKLILLESSIFKEFIQGPDLRKVFRLMDKKEYKQAIPTLENLFYLLNKLYTDRHVPVMLCLCRLVACIHSDPNAEKPMLYADLALHRFEGASDCDILKFYIPLLNLCVKVWNANARDTSNLEARLASLKMRGITVDGLPSLIDSLIEYDRKKYYS